MADILVRPVELRQAAGQLQSSAQKIGQSLQAIDGDIRSLSGNRFMGQRASTLQAHYQAKRDALQKAKELVLHFARELDTAANVFEKADRSGGQGFPRELILPGLLPGSSFWPAYWNFYQVDKRFVEIMLGFLGGRGKFQEALKLLGMSKSYAFFKNGIPYRDTVDTAFRNFNTRFGLRSVNKELGGFFVASVVLGTAEDLIHQRYSNFWETAEINTLDGLVTTTLMVNPYVRAALLVNGGVQLMGNLAIGVDRLQNDFISADNTTRQILLEQSQMRADSLEKIDLGNITRSFSESVCHGFLFTDEGRSDLLGTLKSTVNVLDGAMELSVTGSPFISVATKDIAFLDHVIQDAPFLSEDIKNASSALSHRTLSDIGDYMQNVVNVLEWK